ncbi:MULTISPECIES: HIT domain-containing protein [Dermacoccus]|uniref:HIT domain-containing protein n=1 Tax=Dermacoccus abyssi TaxID=322596 RepID=A0ABX5Z8R3_9MICO|nr:MULTISPECIES: HIT domain-containing protein [Dermacoccus]KLO63150.1 HIT family hydrolase [Dermacoccus sp. PE3]MBE7371754.1 HIT domain-containing protein [Dermacoccus barathri]MBZ4496368.1 HIT domain-containing protein [Dermacoccus sp. Tok2021]QEH93143.1 HIT domain-containing protein [Dermacoccus abyssi]QNK52213.1 HIT domain-containing protein [Dermacoccus sp. PAMC28757]
MVTQNEDFTPEHAESEHDFAGEPDGFGRLWTPHRMAYIEADRPSRDAGDGCPFCAAPGKDDAEGLIVHRGEHCFVVMNLFPYNPGHLLVCPYRHVPHYIDLTDAETEEFTKLTKQGIRALKAASNPAGFNLGMNQGDVAGAGVAAHLHQHIVPRWGGDMNFMPIVGQTKALPVLLEDSRQRIAASWPTD